MPHRRLAASAGRRMTIALIPGLVTLIVIAASMVSMRMLQTSRSWVAHTRDILELSQSLLTRVVDAETGQRAFLVTGRRQFLEPYNGAEQDVRQKLQRLQTLTRDNPIEQQRLKTLDTLISARFAAFNASIAAQGEVANNPQALSQAIERGKQGMDDIRATIAALNAEETRLLQERDAYARRDRELAFSVIAIGGVLAVVISLITNRSLAHNIEDLDRANIELSEQAQRLEEQASELESQATELEATATELETANVELEEQATELEEQRNTAQAARAQAEQANAAKSRFLSTMSHELRTPLNAVTGYVDLMDAGVHGPVTPAQREDIRRINRAVAQLTSVINDILNFAKLEAGEVTFDIGPVHMSEALANASALMEPQAAAKGVTFNYTSCESSLTAWADRERVQQIVLNLLSNAVKYTPAGGNVTMECDWLDEQTVCVSVSDTGRGISEHDMHRIFDPFVQLHSSQHAPSDGVGLGLAIGRDLARGMNGEIRARSEVGKGSVFELTLPGMTPSALGDRDPDPDGSAASALA